MKSIKLFFSLIFILIALSTIHGCSSIYTPNDDLLQVMTVKQAQEILNSELITNESRIRVKKSSTHTNAYFLGDKVDAGISRLVTSGENFERVFYYEELPVISLNDTFGTVYNGHIMLSGEETFMVKHSGKAVADALYVLKNNAIKQKKEMKECDEKFAGLLHECQEKGVNKTPLPEEAYKYKYQAEGAVNSKSFYDAAEFFDKALKTAPCWSAGYFNRALVLAEIHNYQLAIHEMNHYLKLVPNASNAREAKNKIYDWERMSDGK